MACIMVYVAAGAELPYWDWVPPAHHVTVSVPHDPNPAWAGVFSKPHVYKVDAVETGCGCGFQYDTPAGQLARDGLASVLEQALARVPEVELFVPFFGPETRVIRPSGYDRVIPDDLRSWRSPLRHDEFLVVTREA